MHKKQLIEAIHKQCQDISKSDIQRVYAAMTEIIVEEIGKGNEVSLRNFGTFKTYLRKESEGFDFGKQKRITVPAKRYPAFTAGRPMKDAANKIKV